MPDARCIVTAPLSLARGLGFNEIAMVVAADALVRRAWALGRGAELLVPTLAGDLSTQYAFERDLAKEGHNLATLDPEEVLRRLAEFDEQRRVMAAEAFSRLTVTADVGAAVTGSPTAAVAARTAFVKLFEEGSVEETERVVSTCPRCRTTVDDIDAERLELEEEIVTAQLATASGDIIEVRIGAPELLPGVVAIAVPEGTAGIGSTVRVPIADRDVPVLVSDAHAAASAVVPAHDATDHAFALSAGLRPVMVLDAEGTVCAEGPLNGLGRYAARAAAHDLLAADGAAISTEAVASQVLRCASCGTVLVPQLGRHWFLRAAVLTVAAADAVRDGLVAFTPADAREAFVVGTGSRGDWCLSASMPGGVPLPVATCLDCGKVTVDAEFSSSCGRCMGTLVAEGSVLDARFVAAMWAVSLGGWPGRGDDMCLPEETLAVVSARDLVGWVLSSVGLGLRLAGAPPFAAVVVHPWPEASVTIDGAAFGTGCDRRVLRMALVAGTDDLEVAAAAVAALDRPAADDIDPVEAADAASAGVSALDDGSPAQAAGLLASALAGGVPQGAADRLRALALPILGD